MRSIPWATPLALLPLLPFATGCTQTLTTEVRLRDPSLVAVRIDTPDGPRDILPAGHDAMDVELPRTEPPYRGTALFEAHAMRDGRTGAITLRCDACLGHPLEHVVPGDGLVTYNGLAQDRVQWSSGQLSLAFTHLYSGPGRYVTSNEAYRVWLVTPESNVVQVLEKRTTPSYTVSLPVSIALTTIFTAAIVGGVVAMASYHSSEGGSSVPGIVALSVGIVGEVFTFPLFPEALWTAQHPSTQEVIYGR